MLCNYSRYLGSQRRGENFLQLAQVGFGDGYGVGFASLVPRPPRCILLYCQVMNTGARCLELLLQRGDVFARGGRPAHSYDHSRQVDTPRFPHVRLGAYAIRALPDLCFGIVSGRLGHLDPWTFISWSTPWKAPASPPGL